MMLVVGSANSSNSLRLAELARASGVIARLVDGPDDIDLSWFTGDEAVAISAGASAPESVVQRCVTLLERRFPGVIEVRVVCKEEVRFLLPKSLRTALNDR